MVGDTDEAVVERGLPVIGKELVDEVAPLTALDPDEGLAAVARELPVDLPVIVTDVESVHSSYFLRHWWHSWPHDGRLIVSDVPRDVDRVRIVEGLPRRVIPAGERRGADDVWPRSAVVPSDLAIVPLQVRDFEETGRIGEILPSAGRLWGRERPAVDPALGDVPADRFQISGEELPGAAVAQRRPAVALHLWRAVLVDRKTASIGHRGAESGHEGEPVYQVLRVAD